MGRPTVSIVKKRFEENYKDFLMHPRLLFFEGPPGGGKSSLSQFVAQQLQAAGKPVYWLEEHPLNDTVFAPFLGALEHASPAAITTLLTCWRDLLQRVSTDDAVYCLDGAFFHSTLKLLLAYDYDPATIAHYLQNLYDLLTPFCPPLLHLTGDVAAIVRMTIAERGTAWATNVAADIAQYPCQQRQGQAGIEGMVDFFVTSQAQLEQVAATYPFAYHRLDTTARAWAQYQKMVCAWLDISIYPVADLTVNNLAQYVGTYQTPEYFPSAFNHPFQVELTPAGLYLHMVFMRNFRLVAQGPDRFAIAGRPLHLDFVRDEQGVLTGAIYPFVPDQRFFCPKLAAG